MPGTYNRKKAKALSERQRRRAHIRWKRDRERRDAEEPLRRHEQALADSINLPRHPGDPTHAVQITDLTTGEVFRWVAMIGPRRDQVVFRSHSGTTSKPAGWTWFLDHLRPYLCGRKLPRRSTIETSTRAQRGKIPT